MPRTFEKFEEIRNEKKKIILEAALELFANQGYTATSISQIAKEANISKGLMYNYFKSKEELLITIMTNLVDELIETLDADHDNKITEDEALAFVDKFFDFLKTKTKKLKLFSQFSIQPDVIKFIKDENIIKRSSYQSNLFLPFFEEKHGEKAKIVLINLSAIIKGITIQYVFAPEMFPDELINEYKEYIKDTLIRNIK